MGILKWENEYVSGEYFVISSVLTKYLENKQPIIFDVGANIGNYSEILNTFFPNATIYSFEPNKNTFEFLYEKSKELGIKCYQLGISSQASRQKIYTQTKNNKSELTSCYKDILIDINKDSDIIEMDFETTTIDEFCIINKIQHIDFLKIDIEGHELEALKGANEMILHNQIDIIQFEFNYTHIISRVFLRDFYSVFNNYNLYRIDSDRLIPLFTYDFENEIFRFQNFLAIRKQLPMYQKIDVN